MQELVQRIDAIEARNVRVAGEKAWETSWVRRGSILAVTYVCTMLLLRCLGHDRVFIHALVPPMGYLLSTLALPQIKEWWLGKYVRDQR
ncbi:MAG: hypothetical protein ABL897_09245 [Hyphomicrobium sp.]